MSTDHSSLPGIDTATLARLEPLGALAPASLDRLAQIAQVHPVARGDDVLAARDWTGNIVYLLRGELKIEYPHDAAHQAILVVVGGSGRGRMPVWSAEARGAARPPRESVDWTQPPLRLQAITDSELLSLDEETLDLVVTWDQLAQAPGHESAARAAAAATASGEARPEWRNLSGLCADQRLVTSAFANVPAANIPQLLASFERMDVARGDTIVRQGDEGDYYYLIERGRCSVKREIGGAVTELAELCDGEGFGEEALVAAARRNATVTMKTDGVLWRLAKADFVTLLQAPLLHSVRWSDIRAGGLKDAVWLDTRFPVEFRQNGVAGAINVPLNEIRDASGVLDKSRDYIVYCQTGRRSSAAAFLLSQRGIRAHLLEGGLNAMNEAQEPVA